MRILVISNLFPPHFVGGAEILCEQVCRALRDRGHQISVLTSGSAVAVPAQDGIEVLRTLRLTRPFGVPATAITEWDRWRTFRLNYAAARRAIATSCPDVVFVWSQRRLSIGALRAARDAGCPLVYSFNDDAIAAYAPGPLRLRPRAVVRRLVNATVMRRATLAGLPISHATAISRHLKRQLFSHGVDTSGTRVIYQALEIDRFPPKPSPGFLHDPLRLLSASSLLPEKGVHTIVEAAHRLARRGPRAVELTILGDGIADYTAHLRALADLGPARVTFRGRVPHSAMAVEYRAHDVLVFGSSPREAFGLTQLEAMASGTTVVSTDVGGHGEMIVDGRNALAFPFDDATALAECLSRLVDDPALSARLARSARAQVARHFTFDRYVTALEALLHEALEQPHALRPSA